MVFFRMTNLIVSTALVLLFCARPVEARQSHDGPQGPILTRFNDFNRGWGPSFKGLQRELNPERDYVTWIIEEPKAAMDLRSAEQFRRSFYQMPLDTNTISHMMIAWSCHDTDGRRLIGTAAQTGEETEQTRRLVASGWGMTSFWAEFTDGSIDAREEFEKNFAKADEEGFQVAHVTFEVGRENCRKMLAFLKSYLNHPHKPYRHFGLTLDPARYQGGGCGSFASTMLAQAGVLSAVQPLMWRTLRGSRQLMGAGLGSVPENTIIHLPTDIAQRVNFVWFGDLLQYPWTAEDGPELRIVDPEMGILSLREIALGFSRLGGVSVSRVEKTGFNLRRVGSGAFEPIDDRFDRQAAEIVAVTRANLAERLNAGEKIRPVAIGKHWGLIVGH